MQTILNVVPQYHTAKDHNFCCHTLHRLSPAYRARHVLTQTFTMGTVTAKSPMLLARGILGSRADFVTPASLLQSPSQTAAAAYSLRSAICNRCNSQGPLNADSPEAELNDFCSLASQRCLLL